VAAESGQLRAARLNALAEEHAAKADRLRLMAQRIDKGNIGEERIAALLDTLDGAGWTVLNDRYKSPSSPANLDHVVVGPPGVFVIDAKNWTGGRLRLDERGMALGRYRHDDELHSARVDATIVGRHAAAAVPEVLTTGMLAFVEDVGLTEPAMHQAVVLLQADQLLLWLTSEPRRLDPQQVHQIASTLDAVLPPRSGGRQPLVVPVDLAIPTRPAQPAAGRHAAPRGSQRRTGEGRLSQGRLGQRRGSPVRPGQGPKQAARRAAQGAVTELADLLKRLCLLVVLVTLILFVGLPLAMRLLPPLITSLLQRALPAATSVSPAGVQPTAKACAPTPASLRLACAPVAPVQPTG
jgi:hypothetical protein